MTNDDASSVIISTSVQTGCPEDVALFIQSSLLPLGGSVDHNKRVWLKLGPYSCPRLLIPKELCVSEICSEGNFWNILSRIDSGDSDCGNEPVTPVSGVQEVRGYSSLG